ncbi:hypothetical protein QYE76_000911 [Lolium multiflorum]|uniref:F-box domain-containing protein n=1 Tax=Lolium multiflorum TaxID=4521 RepID=A0AAD8VZ66_LOLMU|nr:hypothetical protein QYE76_000911 [Lolium multiflorum]
MARPPSTADPHLQYRRTERPSSFIHSNLPDPPVSTTARLRAALTSAGVDRISRLPDSLLREIVSRLPAKDAARTALLAARWRGVWRSTPVALVDTHLLPNGASASSPDVTDTVSHILAAHPGPFRCVHLTRARMGEHPAHLRLWLRLLAARGVQELVLVNRPSPSGDVPVPLPKTLFTISTLTRLYIGVWKFPDAAGLGAASFPHLRELGICSVAVETGDIDLVVARSPVLEILNIQGTMKGVHLRLISKSLRCVQICAFVLESVEVVSAPCLERLILSECLSPAGVSCTTVKIGNAPKLTLFGKLETGKYALEIQDTVIRAGIKTGPSMMLTSVKTLSLKVRFGIHNDVKMVPAFLKCFPCLEALHIMSGKCDHPAGKLNLEFWEEVGPIVGVRLRMKVMTFLDYHAQQDEIAFLQYIFQNAQVLKYVLVSAVNPRYTPLSNDDMFNTLYGLSDDLWLSKFSFAIGGTHGPEGGEPWTFQRGANFSDSDPLAPVKFIIRAAGPETHQQKPQADKTRQQKPQAAKTRQQKPQAAKNRQQKPQAAIAKTRQQKPKAGNRCN